MTTERAATVLGVASARAASPSLAGGIGVTAAIALLLVTEAGVPVPIPADLVMLALGVRAGDGGVPLVVAVLAFEAVAIVGTIALFLTARGPGYALVRRAGSRVGLTAARLDRATSLIERRGRPALAVGRATPGLRTLTVIAAGASGLSARQALPALIAGSSAFLQLHLFLGYFLGSAAVHVLHAATGPALVAMAVIVAGGIIFWFARRSRRLAAGGLAEAACPACLAVAYLSDQSPDLQALTRGDDSPAKQATKPGHRLPRPPSAAAG